MASMVEEGGRYGEDLNFQAGVMPHKHKRVRTSKDKDL